MARKIAAVLMILLTAALIALFLFGVIDGDVSLFRRLPKVAASVVVCILTVIRLLTQQNSVRELRIIENHYAADIKEAFRHTPALRKKLVRALRDFNSGEYEKSAKLLIKLQPECREPDDFEAVGIFLGRDFTEMQLFPHARKIYEHLIGMNITSSRIYSNLANVCFDMGDQAAAISYATVATQLDSKNPYAHHNLATVYFRLYEFDKVKEAAAAAMHVQPGFTATAKLLAIVYTLEGNDAEAEKYAHMALAGGTNPADLKAAIAHYRSAMSEHEDAPQRSLFHENNASET